MGDFNGENQKDLAVISAGYNTVTILLGYSPNNDGKQDILIVNGFSNNVSILLSMCY